MSFEWAQLLGRIVDWLRAGYPEGIPEQDRVPLLALLGRRLSDDEVEQVVAGLVAQGTLPADRVEAGVAITRLTQELPRDADLARVRERLNAVRWPVEETWRPPVLPDGPSEHHARVGYHDDLRGLAELLHTLCLRAGAVVALATTALVQAELSSAETAIDLAAEAGALRAEIEREAARLLALQSPVAGELRQVVTAIQLGTHLRRMAALAAHIAAAARRRHPEHVVPEPVRPLVARMGAAAEEIAAAAAEVLESGDAEAAAGLADRDETMNDLHEELLATVLGPLWDHGVAAAVDLTLIGRYYERFADNAVEVGRRTVFTVTGVPVGPRQGELSR
ncbi:DUF3349 domain-containing protein [Nocardia harenae]|uniref:DUF3349 domain-containing protein n=1 Tax=Nocardia harenae TaxID=358707 RepID=UPI000A03F58B|nr:DUF3349 domain-containing protein [Nocardia harenae]